MHKQAITLTTVVFASTLLGCIDNGDDSDYLDDTDLDAAALVIHPDDDTAGSMIRVVEGVESESDTPPLLEAAAVSPGMDVSGYQGNVNWAAAKSNGARFVYIKATEGTTYRNPSFSSQYGGSYSHGIIRGAYHFALPNVSSGATQANYFVNHGGGWSNDGKTLPPAVDLEWNPYGASCYGKSQAGMVAWIRDFVNTVHARTGRWPTIYTSTSWWSLCTGNNGSFGADPLWIARYAASVGTLPHGWSFHTIWQNADHGVFPGDHDYFNGAYDRVQAFTH